MASWCTEPNHTAMISPTMRADDHGLLRGDVSISHCMQSLFVSAARPKSDCSASWAAIRRLTTGSKLRKSVLAALCRPVVTAATSLVRRVSFFIAGIHSAACKESEHPRLQELWRNSQKLGSKYYGLRELECRLRELGILGCFHTLL